MGIRSVKPILFNTDMVRAILSGKKIVTRRVMKPQSSSKSTIYPNIEIDGKICAELWGDGTVKHIKQPYRPGDILYVRETWRPHAAWSGSCIGCEIEYKAGGENLIINDSIIAVPETVTPWRPSIHMPREAARIWLRVTDVRVERLQEITDREAEKEGVGDLFYKEIGFGNKDYGCITYSDSKGVIGFMKEQFAYLWDSTIKPADLDRYGWAANPWVWVVVFERCEKPKDAGERRRL